MLFPRMFHHHPLSLESESMVELLELNEITQKHGLVLTPEDIQKIIVVRNEVLRDYGRIELGVEVTKELIKVFSASPYMDQDHFVDKQNVLHEIFYCLKNETEDRVGDVKLIQKMKDCFDGPCAGSLELLRSKMEQFAEDFRKDMVRSESLFEGDESF